MLFYETFGNTSIKKPYPLVFLHGFLGSRVDWMPVITLLQKEYECIAIDLPAHGKSSHSQNIHLEVEIALQQWPNAILVGYSLGGRLSLGFGQKHPEKIKGVIALSAHPGLSSKELRDHRLQNDLAWQNRLITLSSSDFLSLWYEQKVFASLQKRPELLKHLLNIRAYHNPNDLASILDQASLAKQPLYQNFQHPLSFLYGEEDISYVELYRNWPAFEKKTIPLSGHAAHLENPFQCAEAIAFFAARYSLQAV